MADQEVPEEIQDYYQTERRERAGVAWLLAFGTLIVTILLAGGIFFGGRSLYRRFAGNDDKKPEVAQNDQGEQERPAESTNEQSQESNQSAENGGQGNSVQGDNNASPAPSSTPTPATGDASGDLPGTGPGSTVSIFFVVSILGYIVHRLYVKTN